MIIDFHTHVFPDKIAEKALKGLSDSSRAVPYLDGTVFGRKESMKKAGIDYCVNLPVATKATQVEGINTAAIVDLEKIEEMNDSSSEITAGVIPFGAMHPGFSDVKNELKRLKNAGIKGIKIHPAFYGLDIADMSVMNIIYEAAALDLIVLTHSGWDIGFEERNYIPVESLLRIDKEIGPDKMVLAHMGGWMDWDRVLSELAGSQYYFDTSFSIGKINARPDLKPPMLTENLDENQFVRLCKTHGVDKILFGTDSPWSDQSEYVGFIKKFDFTDEERELIFSGNAMKILGLNL